MAFNFPNTPTVGQVFNGWVWDGSAWQVQGAVLSDAVRYGTVQGLTGPQQVQGRANIYAAPFDAMAYSGMQINGSMDVSQENGTSGRTTIGYVCDGWRVSGAGTYAFIAGQAASSFVNGFPSFSYINISTAQTSLGAADHLIFFHPIEGWRAARLAWGTASAQPLTIGFWSWHTPAGLYTGAIVNGTSTRAYAFSYTQAVAGVAQYNTITIPGDTTGPASNWKSDNTLGIQITFALACGTTYTAPSLNTWLAGNYVAGPGQVNGAASISNSFRITGLVVLPGTQVPTSAQSPLIMRSADQELLLCRRYWRKTAFGTGIAFGTTQVRMNIPHEGMRAAPTLGETSLISITDIYQNNLTQTGPGLAISANSPEAGTYDFGGYTGLVIGRFYILLQPGGLVTLDARL